MTGELRTLPRPSSAVRCRPFMQVDGSCSSADVAGERRESEWLAVKSFSKQCKDAAAMVLPTSVAGCCNGWRPATALSGEPVQSQARVAPVWPPRRGLLACQDGSGEGVLLDTSRAGTTAAEWAAGAVRGSRGLVVGPQLGARDPSGWRSQVDRR